MESIKLIDLYRSNDYAEVSKNTNGELKLICVEDDTENEVYISEEDAKKMCDHIKLIFGDTTVSSAGKEVKWWPCKFGEVVAKGHYMVKTSRGGITSHNHMVIDELNPTVYYYYAVSLFKIQLPGESSPASTVQKDQAFLNFITTTGLSVADQNIIKGVYLKYIEQCQ